MYHDLQFFHSETYPTLEFITQWTAMQYVALISIFDEFSMLGQERPIPPCARMKRNTTDAFR